MKHTTVTMHCAVAAEVGIRFCEGEGGSVWFWYDTIQQGPMLGTWDGCEHSGGIKL